MIFSSGFFYFYDMNEKKKYVEIYNDTLNYLEIFIASVLFTITISLIGYYFYLGFEIGFNINWFKMSPSFISVSCSFLVPAIKMSEVNLLHISDDNSEIIHSYKVGIYKKINHIFPEEIQYVAINKEFSYNVNLWYYENGYKNFKIASYYKKNIAFGHAKLLAKTLKIDLLDKIDVHKPIWTEFKDL